MSSSIQVVQKFLHLAKDVDTHTHMMGSEQILNGLVSYLSCKDNNEIVEIASECLKLLAREEKNRQVLYKTKGLVSILTALTGSKNTRVKKNAISAMKRLNKYAQEDTENNSTHSLSSSSNVASKHNITHLHQQQQKSTVEEGKTVIDKKPGSQQQSKNSVGEYVDFEEID